MPLFSRRLGRWVSRGKAIRPSYPDPHDPHSPSYGERHQGDRDRAAERLAPCRHRGAGQTAVLRAASCPHRQTKGAPAGPHCNPAGLPRAPAAVPVAAPKLPRKRTAQSPGTPSPAQLVPPSVSCSRRRGFPFSEHDSPERTRTPMNTHVAPATTPASPAIGRAPTAPNACHLPALPSNGEVLFLPLPRKGPPRRYIASPRGCPPEPL